MKRAIREHLRDFIAIGGLIILAALTAGVILSQQRLKLPDWVPFLGSDRFELKAELSSAQAVTPGQGQTVNINGVKVGDLSKVELINGKAVVTMELATKYADLIHTDASFLLRPRTGLQDMTLDLDPGSPNKPTVPEGFEVPSANTAPNVQPDQILASLDADTQDYLKLLVNGGGEALSGDHALKLSADLKRLNPLARDLAKINGALAKRRQNVRRSITLFKNVSGAIASNDSHLGDFVRNSNDVLDSFAKEQDALKQTFRELPSTLQATRGALASGERFANTAGPASLALLPSARALGPALRQTRPFFRKTVGPIKNQIRPFTKQTTDVLRHIGQGTPPLDRTTKGLAGGIGELNNLFNSIAYNPPGQAEGYAFWLAWLNHNTNSLFLTQDAMGPQRRGIVQLSCFTGTLAEGLAAERPYLRTLQQITNVPYSGDICPLDSALPKGN
jgi:phospholipid/cholesterol/gamma-HCH transport system substrate-binding protein